MPPCTPTATQSAAPLPLQVVDYIWGMFDPKRHPAPSAGCKLLYEECSLHHCAHLPGAMQSCDTAYLCLLEAFSECSMSDVASCTLHAEPIEVQSKGGPRSHVFKAL